MATKSVSREALVTALSESLRLCIVAGIPVRELVAEAEAAADPVTALVGTTPRYERLLLPSGFVEGAAGSGDTERAAALLPSIAEDGEPLSRALQRACIGGRLAAVRLLVGEGADLETVGSEPRPQNMASAREQWGDRDSQRWAPSAVTPLRAALDAAQYAVAAEVICLGASPEGAGRPGWTDMRPAEVAVHIAAMAPDPALLRRMVGSPAEGEPWALVTRQDWDGQSPLHLSADAGHAPVVAALLELSATPAVQNARGETPLHLASAKGNAEAAEMLLRAGADPAIADHDGRTALHATAGAKSRRTAKRAFAESPPPPTEAALVAAAAVLLRFGADSTVADGDGLRPLHLAARAGGVQRLELLLEAGAPPDAASRIGETALHAAVRAGHRYAVDSLLLNGADPSIPYYGAAPVALAKTRGNFALAARLEAWDPAQQFAATWTARGHQSQPPPLRRAVHTVLLVAARHRRERGEGGAHPSMPHELWLTLLERLRGCDFCRPLAAAS